MAGVLGNLRIIAFVHALTINAAGAAASAAWLPVAAAYKVLWSRVAKEEGWNTLALMRRVPPLSTLTPTPTLTLTLTLTLALTPTPQP